ncbi:hypothetical protein Gotur_029181 [Gossypium turneri]
MQQQELLMHNHAAEALLHASMTELHGKLVSLSCKDVQRLLYGSRRGEDRYYRIASAGCFHSLGFLSLFSSHYLRDMSWVTFAQHLEELSIWQCLGLEEIISWEKHNEVAELKENSNFFSKLPLKFNGAKGRKIGGSSWKDPNMLKVRYLSPNRFIIANGEALFSRQFQIVKEE